MHGYFDQVSPGVLIDGCHKATLDHTLLYVGIAPKEAKEQAVKPSIGTLRHRKRDHFSGNAEGSTLRLTLGCLLSDALTISEDVAYVVSREKARDQRQDEEVKKLLEQSRIGISAVKK